MEVVVNPEVEERAVVNRSVRRNLRASPDAYAPLDDALIQQGAT